MLFMQETLHSSTHKSMCVTGCTAPGQRQCQAKAKANKKWRTRRRRKKRRRRGRRRRKRRERRRRRRRRRKMEEEEDGGGGGGGRWRRSAKIISALCLLLP